MYNNEGSLIEDDNIPECAFPRHTSISDANSNTKLIIVSSSLKGRVRKMAKGNNNSNTHETTKADEDKRKESDNDDNNHNIFSEPYNNNE